MQAKTAAKTHSALAEILLAAMLADGPKWIPIITDAIRRDVVWPAQYRMLASRIADLHRLGKLTPELLAADTGADPEFLLSLKAGFGADYESAMNEHITRMMDMGKRFGEQVAASRLHKGEISRQEAVAELLSLDSIGATLRATDSISTAEEFLATREDGTLVVNPTGILPLDIPTEQFGDHESTVIMGRFGAQKSRLLRNCLLAMAARGARPIQFCAEGYRRPTVAAYIAMIADSILRARGQWDHPDNTYKLKAHGLIRPPYYWKSRPKQSAAVYDAVALWKKLGIRVLDADDGADDSDTILSETIRHTHGDKRATLVAIDYMQKVKTYERDFKGRRRLVSKPFESSELHSLLVSNLRKTGAHVLFVGQMNENANQGNRGGSSGYKGGGGIPQEVDNALDIVFRQGIDEWVELESTKMRNSGYLNLKLRVIKDSGLLIGYEDIHENEVPIDIIPRDMLVEPADQSEMEL